VAIAPNRAMATCVKQTAVLLNRTEARYVVTIHEGDGAEPFTVRTLRLLAVKSRPTTISEACQAGRDLETAWKLVEASLEYYGPEKVLLLREEASHDAKNPRRFVVYDPETKKPKMVDGQRVIADFDPN